MVRALAGEGRVHLCLRFNKDKLSDRCRHEETKLAAIEYSDIRLATKLNKLCSEERAVYCKVGLRRSRLDVANDGGAAHSRSLPFT